MNWRRLMTSERIAVWVTALIILAVIGMALYGYFSGSWEPPPDAT